MKPLKTNTIVTILFFAFLRLALTNEELKNSTNAFDDSRQNFANDASNVKETLSQSVLSSNLLKNLDLSKVFHEASNEIGLPFALRNNLIETLKEKGFLNLRGASLLLKPAEDER